MGEWIRNKRRTDGFPRGLEGKKVEARHRDGEIFTGVVGEHEYLQAESFNTADGCDGDVMAYRILEAEPALPDTDGWIEWHGGECPVAKGTLVDVKYRDGDKLTSLPANKLIDQWPDASESFWMNSNHHKDIIAYRLSKPDWPEDRVDVIGQNGNDGLHYDVEQNPAPEVIEKLQQLASNAEDAFERGKQSGGGKLPINSYYHVHVSEPASKELAPYTAECADIIEALNMTFNEGEAFKAIWRMASARMGNGKEGNNQLYDADKIAHYGLRIAAMARRK